MKMRGKKIDKGTKSVTSSVPTPTTATRYMTCGNCGDRLPLGNDPIENHHVSQTHKLSCPGRAQAATDHAMLVSELESEKERLASPEPKAIEHSKAGRLASPAMPARARGGRRRLSRIDIAVRERQAGKRWPPIYRMAIKDYANLTPLDRKHEEGKLRAAVWARLHPKS